MSATVPDPYLTNEDALQLVDFIDGIKRFAGGLGYDPTDKLTRMRNALAQAAARGGDIYLDADGPA